MNIPLLADLTQSISRDYGVLKEDEGIAYRSVLLPPSNRHAGLLCTPFALNVNRTFLYFGKQHRKLNKLLLLCKFFLC